MNNNQSSRDKNGVEAAFYAINPRLKPMHTPSILTDRNVSYEGFTEEEAQTIKEARIALFMREKR